MNYYVIEVRIMAPAVLHGQLNEEHADETIKSLSTQADVIKLVKMTMSACGTVTTKTVFTRGHI